EPARLAGAAWGGVIVRKLKVSTFVTLDGVMQAPGGPDEDRSGGFTNGGWSVGYWDDRMGKVMGDFMGRPFELLLGRRTYGIFAGGAIPAGLKVVDVTTSSTGVVIATYERAGEIKYGSFALDEPNVDELERRPKVASG